MLGRPEPHTHIHTPTHTPTHRQNSAHARPSIPQPLWSSGSSSPWGPAMQVHTTRTSCLSCLKSAAQEPLQASNPSLQGLGWPSQPMNTPCVPYIPAPPRLLNGEPLTCLPHLSSDLLRETPVSSTAQTSWYRPVHTHVLRPFPNRRGHILLCASLSTARACQGGP